MNSSAIPVTTEKAKLRRLLSAGLGNQVISSLTNFAFGVYLLKAMQPADYGLYNIAFAVMAFIGGFSQGFFLVQMTVLSPARHADDRTPFAARTLQLLVAACATFMVMASLGILALQVYGLPLGTASLPWLIALTAVAYMLKEFHIRHAFNEARGHDAVLVHAALALALLIGVLISETIGQNMQVDMAMFLYMLAHVLAAALGQWRSGMTFSRQSITQLRATFEELRIGGKWAAATNVVYAIRNQAHTVVVAASIGAMGVAQLSASRLLVTPAILLLPALSQVALPKLAELRETQGDAGLWRAQRRITMWLLAIAVGYSALLLASYPLISSLVFSQAYLDLYLVTAAWCACAIAMAMRSSLELVAQVQYKFSHLTMVTTISAVITLLATLLLSLNFGILGAALGLTIGELATYLGFSCVIKKSKKIPA